MGDSDQVLTFSEACSKGHHLFGRVKYCPFCGVTVVQPDAATRQANTPSSQPVAVMAPQKNETAAPIPLAPLQPEIKAMAPEMEPSAQPETKQQPQILPAPQLPLESPKPEPVTPLSSSPATPAGKTFPASPTVPEPVTPLWMVATGGLIVLLILIQMFGGDKTEAPEQVVAEARRSVSDSTSMPIPEPPKKHLPQKMLQPSPIAEQWASVPMPETTPKPKVDQTPTEAVSPAPIPVPKPKEDCPAGEITNKTRNMINGNNWGEASQFINRQLDQNPACSSNRELLILQDMALEIKKYTRDKNPRSAKSGFHALIDKYGENTDLIKMRGFFNDALNKENDCAASGRTWDPANFSCN